MTHAVNHVGKPKVSGVSRFTTITMRQSAVMGRCCTSGRAGGPASRIPAPDSKCEGSSGGVDLLINDL